MYIYIHTNFDNVKIFPRNYFHGGCPNFHDPRHKIDSIIRRQTGVPDEDAPDDLESTRFWASTGGKFEDKESMTVSMNASANVKSTPETISGLMAGGNGLSPGSGPLALTNGSAAAAASNPSLEALVGVMNSSTPGPKAKAKAKGKAKAKANPQLPKTPVEQRDASRVLVLTSSVTFSFTFTCEKRQLGL